MLDRVKRQKSSDSTKMHAQQRTGFGRIHKIGSLVQAKDHAMKCRIQELEAEVEELRSTVKFYQDIVLHED